VVSGGWGGLTSDKDGYCKHGIYVGGVMEDYICGYCEDGE